MSDKVYWKAGPLYLELLRRWKQMTKTACSLTGSMSHRSSSGRFLMIYLLFESHRTVWDFSWNLFFWRNHQSFLVMRSNYIEFCRKQKTVWMKPNIQAESFLDAPKNSKRWEQHQHTEWPQITSEGFFFFFFVVVLEAVTGASSWRSSGGSWDFGGGGENWLWGMTGCSMSKADWVSFIIKRFFTESSYQWRWITLK